MVATALGLGASVHLPFVSKSCNPLLGHHVATSQGLACNCLFPGLKLPARCPPP